MTDSIEFLEMHLTSEDRKKLGKEVTSAFLVLALAADEIMQLQHLWLMSMEPHPDHPAFRKVARARSHMLLRMLNLKVVEAVNAQGGFQKALGRRYNKKPLSEIKTSISEIWRRRTKQFTDSEYFVLAKYMRNHLGGHCPTSEVEKWLDNISSSSEERFLFHRTKANSVFPAVDDMVFGAFLNTQFVEAYGSGTPQEKFEGYLKWLAPAANHVVNAFHEMAGEIFIRLLNKARDNLVQYSCDEEFIADSAKMKLPLMYLRQDDR
ncbi:hypothetical protein [Thalassovita aquimarina]|uniref:Uncharacterized protein n=1 Tax=Thalassovita aquimarina TaxID=2785917 RepID=A0ABS5HNV0_9RHOB|nr:hypothetical protein [Thalassovita aquimarina]MBR9650594.1 hypothetical protein [Thalassovita aquimarina]